ncbi:sodium/calcium exchanger regulatory protein 1-like isoform X6 [Branchiostoma lanceolatum]|uniref:sodium/calcium exchanger regulatory protein 1-like isoform X6 n=1 Tax=Branchiostoma lanceolatum TaxID=7740 RepID=UPI0034524DD2
MAGSSITGKWKLDHNEGFEEFLGEMGAPLLARKAASKTSPTQQIVINGTQVTIKLKSMMITKEMEFNIGQEFETEWSGIKSKAMARWEDGRLVVRENGAVGETITSRYIDGNGMLIMEITSPKGLVCRRYFKKKSE